MRINVVNVNVTLKTVDVFVNVQVILIVGALKNVVYVMVSFLFLVYKYFVILKIVILFSYLTGECGLSCVRISKHKQQITFNFLKGYLRIFYSNLKDQSCNKIEDFPNGRTFYNPDNLFGGHLIYECDPGFKLMGNRIRVCEGDGWWSGSSPVCIKEGEKYKFESFFLS